MTTAFVLSGGGSLGAVQVGMLQALTERQVTPDLLVGTSAGALNAAFVAGRGTGHSALRELADSWASVRRRDIFPLQPLRHVLAATGARPSVCSERGLRHLISSHLTFSRLEDAAIPVHIVTTSLLSGEEVLLSDGEAPYSPALRSPAYSRPCSGSAGLWWTAGWPTMPPSRKPSRSAPTECSCFPPVTPARSPSPHHAPSVSRCRPSAC
jgi:hypothetical protein